MPYWQLLYHLTWTTLERAPWITLEIEPALHGFLRAKASGLGATVFALNGTEDHIHLVTSIPPTISVGKFVGQVKGIGSAKLNRSGLLEHTFRWQSEYGAFTFDRKRLPKIIAYVEAQKEHHSAGTLIPALERVDL